MNSIYYFNINYSCNNNCVFCFSHNTGIERRDIDFDQLAKVLLSVSPDNTDEICINGGEPTLHPDFYKILNFIDKNFLTNTVVYSNGSLINAEKLKDLKRTSFVIPIHGNENLHNEITQNKNSFFQTLRQVKNLQQKNLPYAIKFILNKEMVESKFKIRNFLKKHNLHPNKIFLARLNKTNKAMLNDVQYPSYQDLQRYLIDCHESLKKDFNLIYLDIPLCLIVDKVDIFDIPTIPSFFFTDYRRKLVRKNYYKEIKIFNEPCKKCPKNKICSLMQDSYLTLAFFQKWMLIVE